jgi:hypothetical protein
MPEYSSNHGQILIALEALVKDLQPDNLAGEEVAIRGNWVGPYRGVSIVPMGEQDNPGTVGTQDIGYVCGIVFAELSDYDAILAGDQMESWRELVRRRLKDQRLSVTITNSSDPSEHVMIILRSGEDLSNPKKYPNWSIKRILVAVWVRESN